jgi:hypothetical protein
VDSWFEQFFIGPVLNRRSVSNRLTLQVYVPDTFQEIERIDGPLDYLRSKRVIICRTPMMQEARPVIGTGSCDYISSDKWARRASVVD